MRHRRPATVTYDPLTAKATLTPTAGLIYAKTYTARIQSGAAGVKDMSGPILPPTTTWTFSTEAAPPPIALVDRRRNPFSATRRDPPRGGLQLRDRSHGVLISPTLLGFYDTS